MIITLVIVTMVLLLLVLMMPMLLLAAAVVTAAGAAQGGAVDTSTKAPREFYGFVRFSLLYPTSVGVVGCILTAKSVDCCSLLACCWPFCVLSIKLLALRPAVIWLDLL